MTKRIATFFRDPDPNGYPFDKEYYRTAYAELATLTDALGASLCIVRGQESYLGGNRFSDHATFDGTDFIWTGRPIDADVIYVKGDLKHDATARTVNPAELDDVCVDKWKTRTLFPELSPFTALVRNKEELSAALREIPSAKAVVKPLDREGGEGVMIDVKEAIESAHHEFPLLAQEMIDTSGGIEGITDGPHDLRITSINGEPVLSYVRTPPSGSLLANVARGGLMIEVPIAKIPEGALALWKKVDGTLSRFSNRLYSTDMGLDKRSGWKIIELNSRPGCLCASEGAASAYFQRSLAAHLAHMCEVVGRR